MPRKLILQSSKTGPVKLTKREVDWATSVGRKRHTESNRLGLKNRIYKPEFKKDPEKAHRLGALAELSVAKINRVSWPASVNDFSKKGDLHGLEVKMACELGHRLIVQRDDNFDLIYVLCIIIHDPHTFNVTGWISGRDVVENFERTNPGGYERSWFVPQRRLNGYSKPYHTMLWDVEPEEYEPIDATLLQQQEMEDLPGALAPGCVQGDVGCRRGD